MEPCKRNHTSGGQLTGPVALWKERQFTYGNL